MTDRFRPVWFYLATLLVANLTLLLPAATPLRVIGALLLLGLLPGFKWVDRVMATDVSPPLRWTTAAALSYTLVSLIGLLLHDLPGPVRIWQLLVALNTVAVCPLLIAHYRKNKPPPQPSPCSGGREAVTAGDGWRFERFSFLVVVPEGLSHPLHWLWSKLALPAVLLLILITALGLRATNLHYSEFQGDEALAMLSAAEAVEGHEDALLRRAKGPGEVLLPMALWQLSGVINETIARLPFTIAALLATITIYLIGKEIGGPKVGWLAAAFFAFNGFMVAFGRIVQYQALVIWLSAMAFLMAMQWQQRGQFRYAVLGGLFLGTGLLAHYDTILVLPAIGWLLVTPHDEEPTSATTFSRWRSATDRRGLKALLPLLLFTAGLLLAALPFYLPFALDPQATRTGDYVGQRIGTELRNNLPDFFHFNTFYSSFYYLLLTGLLVLGGLIWLMWRKGWPGRTAALLIGLTVLVVVFRPDLLAGERLDLSALPFGLLFLGAFLATFGPVANPSEQAEPNPSRHIQALIVWLAVPFLGYNFVVALGLTHIYTIVPAWSLLAGLAWQQFAMANSRGTFRYQSRFTSLFILLFFLLSTIFLWNAFVRHDVEYRQDYPAGNLGLFWSPYDEPPETGFFGFAHRSGWKAVGQLIATDELVGDYGSNEEPDVTTWYTRGAPRACDPRPEFYFLAADLVDPIEIPQEAIENGYEQIGLVTLPNQKQTQIMQQMPSNLNLGQLNETSLAREFDQTATPAAFARSARGSRPAAANFGNLVQLSGYDLDTRRAYPGGRLPVTLYWRVLAPLPASYQVFTHLESESGPVAQADGIPVCWSYPTNLWRPGQIIADQHAMPLAADLPPGDYPLEIGFFLPDTFERLDVLDEAGNPAGTSVRLDVVEIRD